MEVVQGQCFYFYKAYRLTTFFWKRGIIHKVMHTHIFSKTKSIWSMWHWPFPFIVPSTEPWAIYRAHSESTHYRNIPGKVNKPAVKYFPFLKAQKRRLSRLMQALIRWSISSMHRKRKKYEVTLVLLLFLLTSMSSCDLKPKEWRERHTQSEM